MLIRKTKTWLTVIALAAVCFSFRAAPADFSGTWALNEGKSELGQFGTQFTPVKISIEQKADVVNITRSFSANGQEMSTTEALVEGKEVDVKSEGPFKRKSTIKWADDKQGFTVSSNISGEFGGQSFEMKGTETWTMAADGKSFTLSSTVNGPQGDISTKSLYEKK